MQVRNTLYRIRKIHFVNCEDTRKVSAVQSCYGKLVPAHFPVRGKNAVKRLFPIITGSTLLLSEKYNLWISWNVHTNIIWNGHKCQEIKRN